MNHRPDPPFVKDYMVPLLTFEYKDNPLENWDLTTQQILPYINGTNHIARVSAEADVDINLVKQCIQNLAYYKVLCLLPILKYSSVYMCTQNLKNLIKDNELSQACRTYVRLNPENPAPPIRRVFLFYASMTHGISLRSICQRLNPQNHNIDERKLVIFGMQHNFIRCIHKYPVFTGLDPIGRQKLYTGLCNFVEICCRTAVFPFGIEKDIDKDTNVTVIWR